MKKMKKSKAKTREKASATTGCNSNAARRRYRPQEAIFSQHAFPEYAQDYAVSFRWYGFDLDGTIADNTHHGSGMGLIGKPIKPMVDLMKRLHKQNKRVKIVTARINDVGASPSAQIEIRDHIGQWCDKNLGFRPEITDRKDGSMEVLYDDRARQVVRNRGVNMEDLARDLAKALDNSLRNPMTNRKELAALRNRCVEMGII